MKKIISIIIALCLIFSISAMAENENVIVEEPAPEASQKAEKLPGDMGNIPMPPSGDMQGRTPPTMPNGEAPPEGMNRGQVPQGNFTHPQNTEGFTPPQGGFVPPQSNATNSTEEKSPQTDDNTSTENPQTPNNNQQFGGQMPNGMGRFPGNMQNFNEQPQEEQPKGFLGFVKTYSTPITSVILLALAFIFVIFYRRKNY